MVNRPYVGSQEGRDQTGWQMKQKMTEIPAPSLFSFPGDGARRGGARIITRCLGRDLSVRLIESNEIYL